MTSDGAGRPSDAQLQQMSTEELVRLGGELDDVHVVSKTSNWPSVMTAPEKRAERAVAVWFMLSMLSAVGFVLAYVLWPSDYVPPGRPGEIVYLLYTPVLGITFGSAVLALGLGIIAYVRKFFPDEISVQQRHDGPADELQRRTAAARFREAGEDSGLDRRSLIRRVVIGAATLFAAAAGVLAVGPFVRNPWKGGDNAALWITGWKPVNQETVYLRLSTGVLGQIVRVRPEDLAPGAMMTVFPFRESDRGDEQLLRAAERASDAPVMLIRFRPGTPVAQRPGQENFHYGDYYAFSKICTHLGCPASLYDELSHISLCPCHQSAFAMNEYGRPVFGPAVRPLPQLPITVNNEGYFVATADFVEPVGPEFWSYRASRTS